MFGTPREQTTEIWAQNGPMKKRDKKEKQGNPKYNKDLQENNLNGWNPGFWATKSP